MWVHFGPEKQGVICADKFHGHRIKGLGWWPRSAGYFFPFRLWSGPGFVSAEVDPFGSTRIGRRAIERSIFPKGTVFLARKTELHDSTDGGDDDGFDHTVFDGKRLIP